MLRCERTWRKCTDEKDLVRMSPGREGVRLKRLPGWGSGEVRGDGKEARQVRNRYGGVRLPQEQEFLLSESVRAKKTVEV